MSSKNEVVKLSLIKTVNGLTIVLQHDVCNPTPYDRVNLLRGVKGVFRDYLDVLDMKDALAILKKYDVRYVLFRRQSPLAYLLSHTRGWKQTYVDETAVLFERNDESAQSAIRAP